MFKNLIHRDYFRDRTVVLLGVIAAVLTLVNIFFVIFKVRSHDFEVPVRYTEYGPDQLLLGEWYTLYELVLFNLVTMAANVLVSARLHLMRRYMSIALLGLNLVVIVYLFFVTQALLGNFPT